MQQPPSDRSSNNPYQAPSAWPRAPEQTFHLRVPKAPPGAKAAAPKPAPKPAAAPPGPARQSSILTGSALPVGYTAPQATPEVEPVAPEPVVEAVAFEPEPEITPAPPFIAPPQAPFAAPRRRTRSENRTPLFIGAAVAVSAVMAGAAWLMLRQPEETATFEPVAVAPTPTPAAREPVITPPAWAGIVAEEPAAEEPELRGATEPVETAAVSQPTTRTARSSTAPLPTGPQPYSGTATPAAPSITTAPLRIPPLPTPPPPASAPGPQTPVADPNAPLTTRDPTSGD